MLRNFFLMLTKKGHKQLQLQEHYQRIVKWQKQVRNKKAKKEEFGKEELSNTYGR
jgi:hypothetical protein